MTGWLEFFIDGLVTQLTEIRDRGEQAIRRDVLIQEHGLSERQAMALRFIMENGSLTIQDFESLCPKANRRTLQRDIKTMVAKGIVIEKASSLTDPTKRYVMPVNRSV
jgi:predicted transcriptional regulator